jgi:CRP-like cAMP-binding protein
VDPERLVAFPLLSSLTADERTKLASWSEEREVSTGVTLASEGSSGYFFYLIEEGAAEVIHDGRVVAELGPGDYFGEGAILGHGRRTASVVSTSPMRLIVMHGQEFRKMEAAMPDVAQRLQEALAARLEELRAVRDAGP